MDDENLCNDLQLPHPTALCDRAMMKTKAWGAELPKSIALGMTLKDGLGKHFQELVRFKRKSTYGWILH